MSPPDPDPDCLFCAIVAGDVPAGVVHSTSTTLAFRDVAPQAPTHVLVVPRVHLPDAAAVAAYDASLLGDLVSSAAAIAEAEGLVPERGYRLVLNTGAGAGQSVFHCHLHLLGGRSLDWPPG